MRKIILFPILILLTSFTMGSDTGEMNANNNEEAYAAYKSMVAGHLDVLLEKKYENEMKKNEVILSNGVIKAEEKIEKVKVNTKSNNTYKNKVVNTSYSEWETFNVSAFTAGYESTGKSPSHPDYGITANGEKVKENYTLACPKSMEFGTKVYIEYFDNTFTCTDRGGAIKEGKLDVYMASLSKAREFGRHDLRVKILK